MNVPFLDIAAAHAELAEELETTTLRVLRTAHYVLGPEVEAFEAEFAAHEGARHCVGVANGLDALYLALRARGIGAGDEVIVPAHTFIATWLAVSQTGASIIPVETDDHYLIDVDAVRHAITPRTKAIVPVHLYGHPADMDPLEELGRQHGLFVLGDAAQAHGARYRDRPLGGLGAAAAYSFYPGKNLGAAGDGGAITTNDDALAARLRILRNYGSSQKYVHHEQGVNSRLDELQAALLRVKLRHLDAWNVRRARLARRYTDALGTGLVLPRTREWALPVWHLYVVRHARREIVRELLLRAGVHTLVHYPTPPHRQGAYAGTPLGALSFPRTEMYHREVFSLPMGPHVTDNQADAVVEAVRHALAAA